MTDNRDKPVFRMARVLKRHKQELKGYSRLANAIREANRGSSKNPVDRRKLKRIVDHQDVSLSTRELIALDTYLTPFGEGFADKPLLEKRSILGGLVEKGDVTLLLGSFPRADAPRNELSRWDVQSLGRLLGEIGNLRPGIHVTVDDVLFDDSVKPQSDPNALSLPYLKDSGPSVSCLGSPRSSWASELMLAAMFKVTPFRKSSSETLPFHFVWSPDVRKFYPSAFAVGANDIKGLNGKLAKEISEERAWALRVGDTVYEVRRKRRKDWKVYGVVAAQRRAGGRVWLVVAGLSGPATFASALALAAHKTGTLPEPDTNDGHSQVLWALVEATVHHGARKHGDRREVSGERVLMTQTFSPQ